MRSIILLAGLALIVAILIPTITTESLADADADAEADAAADAIADAFAKIKIDWGKVKDQLRNWTIDITDEIKKHLEEH
ncbi:hypothetical protein HN011_000084 [Eciton burchellii]|nr:hypothetical protein HN011_000084 [Eciton burchellii]